ncbi:Cell division control protein 45 homolog [Taphrina deformans PYCC 5710]|uniref:Cell division control protein 45 homolog n=1 Tax=Taphrina deformans (strain PYCC 5710 / ATCC 11124 / CBS 356.35 / IMI 108563 / JCM 9778 / NBRC 8474) TaxID=1097556 RepID=R4XAK7_TAPDE|nr:Cell division control protein 45 homolog [Taphrina deformans PYCC 5710]|eukprot:CCG82823.1 Cell division control protein 45 homolog [Taphrina deformans PYCC 5710]
MIIRRSQFASAYTKIRQSSLSGTCAVLILVALDVDALCACKMLATLLKSDFVPYQIRPIAGWSDLEKANATLVQGNEELQFVIMLNFGAHFDPLQYLEVDESVKIYIIDSHKPVLLENCYMDSNVLVWDDGDIERQSEIEKAFYDWHEEDRRRKARDEDDDRSHQSEDDEANEDDIDSILETTSSLGQDGDDGENDSSALGTNRKRRSRSGSDDASQRENEAEDSESDASDGGPRQRRRTGMNTHIQPSPRKPSADPIIPSARQVELERRRAYERNGTILSEYYDRGDWYGESVAGLIYALASDLGREDNELLWLSIVGLTSLAIHNRLNQDNYLLFYAIFKDEVVRLNPPPLIKNGPSRVNGRNPTDVAIRAESEYRFMLFRHWSLYDAMMHSPYLGAKMKIYSEPGKKQLHKLFAKMGFSLAQCRQIYTHMDMDLKRNLREKLEKFAPAYGLDELMLKSFVRPYGFKCTLSASDTSYALTALLETGNKGLLQRAKQGTDEDVSQIDEDVMTENIRDEWLQNFNDAFDALDNVDLLQKAIPVSMALQQAIIRTGTALIDKREIRSLRSFRMSVVKEGPDVAIFTHPLALQKLATWLSEAINELEREKGKTKHLPFVIAALDERTDRYLVLGTSVTNTFPGTNAADTTDRDKINRNKFGNAFQELSHAHQARFRLDSFDASVVECNRADLGQLLETLSLQTLQ